MKSSKDKSRSSFADKFVNRSDILRVLSVLFYVFPDISLAHANHNKISLGKYLKFLLLPLSILLFSAASLATHNPSVSHSADGVTNGTFQDNYTFIPSGQNRTPITVRGNDTQLANLTVWQTFGGVPLASINATGSWRLGGAGTPVLFIDNNTGRVGIGTASPGSKLDLRDGDFLLTDADVSHSMTADYPANMFGNILPTSGTAGGLTITGLVESGTGTGLTLIGVTDATGSGLDPAIVLTGYKRSGTGATTRTGTDGMFRIQTTSTISLFDVLANGNVGIGTSAPFAGLMINKTTPALQVNDSAYFAVSGGRVGIGTTTPVSLLNIYHAASTNANITITEGTNAPGAIISEGRPGSADGQMYVGTQRLADLYFFTGKTPDTASTNPDMIIKLGGNVGLNATTPNATLHILGGGTGGGLRVTNQSNAYEAFFVNSTLGRVGIGTTAPGATLDISLGVGGLVRVNSVPENSNANLYLNTNVSGDRTATIVFQNASTNALLIGLGRGTEIYPGTNNMDFVIANQVSNEPIYLGTNSGGTEAIRFTVTGAGNVGIGTTTPAYLLDVVNTAAAANLQINGSDSNSAVLRVTRGETSDQSSVFLQTRGSQDFIIGVGPYASGTRLDIGNASSPFVSITTAGLVGINDTTPSGILDIDTGGFTDTLVVANTGRVGIGTASPTQNLTVMGDANITGTLYVGSQSFATIDATGNLTVGGSGSIVGNVTINGTLWQPVYPSDDGLVLYLPFSEGVGTTAYDRSPYGNDGALQNGSRVVTCSGFACPNWTNGKYGNALLFGGPSGESGDYVNVSDSSLWAFQDNNFSIEMWTNFADTRATISSLISQHQNDNANWKIYLINGGATLSFRVNNSVDINATVNFANNTWYYVVFVKGGTTGTFYVNGISRGSDTYRNAPNAAADLLIGAGQEGGPGYFWNGTIDEVRVYSRALIADEIRTQYLGGLQSHGAVVADKFRVVNTTANELLRVTNKGDVGIGAASPNSTLHVLGTGTGGGFRVTNQSNAYEAFFVNSTLGRVGIGTAGPAVTLDIKDGSTPAQITLADSVGRSVILRSAGVSNAQVGSTSGHNFDLLADSVVVMTLSTAGRVGINTTTPAYQLHQYGAATTIQHTIQTTSTDSNVNLGLYLDGGSGADWVVGRNVGDASDDDFVIREVGLSDRFVIESGGFVGINTTTPVGLLKINPGPGTAGLNITNAANAPELSFSGTGGQTDIATDNTLSVAVAGTERIAVTTGGDVTLATGTVASPTGSLTVNTSVFHANGTTGKVGIGTTTPISRLSILGSSANDDDTLLNLTAGNTGERTLMLFNHPASIIPGQLDYFSQQFRFTGLGGASNILVMNASSGNVGIGTASPAGQLQLAGQNYNSAFALQINGTSSSTILTNDYSAFGIKNADVTTNNYARFDFVDNQGNIAANIIGLFTDHTSNAQSASLLFGTRNAGTWSEKMRITNGGNVGIGATSPNASLHVLGTGTGGGLRVTNQSNAYEAFFVNSTLGAVGIGTAAPSGIFDVESSTGTTDASIDAAYITKISSGTVANGFGPRISFDAETATAGTNDQIAAIGAVWEDATAGSVDGALVFQTRVNSGSFTERMRINANGNVGIGTATITSGIRLNVSGGDVNIVDTEGKLTVDSTATNTEPSIGIGGSATPVSGEAATLEMQTSEGRILRLHASDSGGDPDYAILASSANGDFRIGHTSTLGNVTLYAGNAERMRLVSNGNVGIGTASPSNELHVNGSNPTFRLSAVATGQARVTFANQSNTPRWNIGYQDSTGYFKISEGTDGALDTNTSLTIVNSTGNVGIGTTSPAANLHVGNGASLAISQSAGSKALAVKNTGGRAYLLVEGTSASQADFLLSRTGGTANKNIIQMVIDTDDTTKFRAIDDSGNIMGGAGASTAAILALQHTSGFVGINTSAPAGQLDVWTNGASTLLVNNSRVGIGTTSPQSPVQINTTNGDGVALRANASIVIDEGFSILGMIAGGTPSQGRALLTAADGGTNILNVQIGADSSIINDITFLNNGGERMRIDGGNVGIGTTAPFAKLHVIGNATIEGNVSINGSLFQPVYPSDDGLVLYLPFSEGVGTTAYDRSPYGNDGTLFGPSWTAGKHGSALSFDGINDRVNVPYAPIFNTSQNVTAMAWFNTKGGANQVIVAKHMDTIGGGGQSWSILLAGSNNITYRYWTTPGGNSGNVIAPVTAGNNTWNHVALSISAPGTIRVYLNGLLIGSESLSQQLAIDDDNVTIGDRLEADTPFNGTIDEVRLYNRSLSADEIRTQYLGGLQSHGTIVADKFRIVNTTGSVTFMIANNSGNVGIGTISPNATLHVLGTGTAGGFRVTNQSNGAEVFFVNSTTGQVGIGTTTPAQPFHVKGRAVFQQPTDTASNILFYDENAVQKWLAYYDNTGLTFYDSADRFTLEDGGQVGIGDTTPDYGLDVVADVNSDDCFREAGTQVAGTCASDARLKKNIQPLKGSLDKILNLKPVEFEWKEGIENLGSTIRYVEGRQVGLVAQDVEKVLPHLVKEKDGYLSVEYNLEMQMMLVNAIQEQQEQIKLVKNENAALKSENSQMQSRLDGIEARLAAMEK